MLRINLSGSGIKKSVEVMVAGTLLSLLPACGQTSKEESEVSVGPGGLAAIGLAPAAFNSIATLISDSVKQAKADARLKTDRQAFLSAISEKTQYELNRAAFKRVPKTRPYNVAMCDSSLRCDLVADEGIHKYVQTIEFQGRFYTVYGFRGGKLNNSAAGGWENWILRGCHDHKTGQGAKLVTFRNTGWTTNNEHGCL